MIQFFETFITGKLQNDIILYRRKYMKDFTDIFSFKYTAFFSVLTAALLFFSLIPNASASGIADPATVKKWISNDAFIVDVRTPQEFNAGNYKGSINIPLAELEKNINRFGNKDRLIIVYCRTGNRSGHAKMILEKYGYKNVLNGGSLGNMLQ